MRSQDGVLGAPPSEATVGILVSTQTGMIIAALMMIRKVVVRM
jgi:hypothetical protein